MDKLLKGYAYDLSSLIRIEGCHGFILEAGEERGHVDEKGFYHHDEPYLYDLGKQRILKIYRSEAYLIMAGDTEIKIFELETDGCRISDFLKKRGFKCSIIAEYGGRVDKAGRRHGRYWETWKMALRERCGIFSEFGYALQYKGWADYTFYQFELNVLNRGWIRIDGHDIEKFVVWNVMEDILEKAKGLIEKSLTEKIVVSGKAFADQLKAVGLKEEIQWLRMYERDDET